MINGKARDADCLAQATEASEKMPGLVNWSQVVLFLAGIVLVSVHMVRGKLPSGGQWFIRPFGLREDLNISNSIMQQFSMYCIFIHF